MFKDDEIFWYFSEGIIEMLDEQVSRDFLNCGKSITK